MRTRKRGKKESLQALYYDINPMAGLAYPGKNSIHRKLAAIDAFIDALGDSNLRMCVRGKEPKSLDHALHIALLAEANIEAKPVNVQDESQPRANNYKARVVQNTNRPAGNAPSASVESINNRCDKICEMLENLFKDKPPVNATSLTIDTATAGSVSTTPTAKANVTCFKCGNLGHYSTTCPEQALGSKRNEGKGPMRCYACQGFGHMARNCPKAEKKEQETTPAVNVREIKGPDTRQLKDYPVYLRAWLGKSGVRFLVDTGCERSVTPRKFIGDSRLEPAEYRIFAANGTVINVVSEVVMNIKISELVLPTLFVVSDNITEPMLGVEWLRCNRMIWDFAKDILLINGKVFHLIPGKKSDSCRRVVATEKVIVPARSQAITPGRVEMTRMTGDANVGNSVWTTEVSELRNGVNVARAILPERLDNLPILVLNSCHQPCEINADTILTELSLAQCTGKKRHLRRQTGINHTNT